MLMSIDASSLHLSIIIGQQVLTYDFKVDPSLGTLKKKIAKRRLGHGSRTNSQGQSRVKTNTQIIRANLVASEIAWPPG